MTTYVPSPQNEPHNVYALTTASAAAGCALGILFGRGMRRATANIAALTLLAAGAVLAGPAAADLVNRLANHPESERGSKKRLEGIRDSAVPDGSDIYTLEEGMTV